MGPIAEQVAAAYADKSVKFVTFDFTSDQSEAAAEEMAQSLGIEGTYRKHAGKTGFALLYDTRTLEVVTTLSAQQDARAWGAELDKALDEAREDGAEEVTGTAR